METDRLKVAEAKLNAAEAKLKGIVEEVMQKERLGNGLRMPEAWIIEAVLKRVPPPPLELPPAHRRKIQGIGKFFREPQGILLYAERGSPVVALDSCTSSSS